MQARLIKKYPNRRLYDTHSSSHVTLVDIRQMVLDEQPFQVVDAKSDGEPIFSSDMLRSIIRFYGPFQGMFGGYLEQSIQAILTIQNQAGTQSSQAWTDFMQKQAPVMQNLMQQYIEQSKTLYQSSQHLFGLFGGGKREESE